MTLIAIVILSVAPVAAQTEPPRFYSEVKEQTPLPPNGYFGFRHRFQHKSLGAFGGTVQAVEMKCGVNSAGERFFVIDDLSAVQDVANGWFVEMFADYACGPDGVYTRLTQAAVWKAGFRVGVKEVAFTDVDVEHEYTVLHSHSIGLTCGSLSDDRSWFFLLDGVKFSCGGYGESQYTLSAPHAQYGQYSLETDSPNASDIKYSHHYVSSMSFYDGTAWVNDDYDYILIQDPTGGHYPNSGQDWYHSCTGLQLNTFCH